MRGRRGRFPASVYRGHDIRDECDTVDTFLANIHPDRRPDLGGTRGNGVFIVKVSKNALWTALRKIFRPKVY